MKRKAKKRRMLKSKCNKYSASLGIKHINDYLKNECHKLVSNNKWLYAVIADELNLDRSNCHFANMGRRNLERSLFIMRTNLRNNKKTKRHYIKEMIKILESEEFSASKLNPGKTTMFAIEESHFLLMNDKVCYDSIESLKEALDSK